MGAPPLTSATDSLPPYFVPNLGPSIDMNPATAEWAERVGRRIERAEYTDLAAARTFAANIHSRVEAASGAPIDAPAADRPSAKPVRPD